MTQDSILSRSTDVQKHIDAKRYNRALAIIHDTVETIITEQLCNGRAYSSPKLDALTQTIGRHIFASLPPQATSTPTAGLPAYAYIATKLQCSGGHTRLLIDFILARPNAQHVIYLTGLAGKSDLEWLKTTIPAGIHWTWHEAPRGNYESSLRWLQSQLVTLSPTHTYLFNHHQDAIAVAALIPEMRLAGSFCHHGDHHLSLGVHLSHLVHLDFHPTSFHRCINELGVPAHYVPFTVPEKAPRSDQSPFLIDKTLTTCTAAGGNKVEISYSVRYIDVIPELLKATAGKHIHIGRLSRCGLAHIRRRMAELNVPPQNFIYIPWVPSVWDALIEHQVDVYISSFPLGGGLTLVEAMGAGIPIAVHRHMMVREWGGLDLLYPEGFTWRTIDELLAYCTRLTPTDLSAQSNAARQHYLKYHQRSNLLPMLENPDNAAPPLFAEYRPEPDEWALWAANHLSIPYLAWRFTYRTYRKLRHHWNRHRPLLPSALKGSE